MTIDSTQQFQEGYTLQSNDSEIVATQKITMNDKLYTVKIFFQKPLVDEKKSTESLHKNEPTIKRIIRAFDSQIGNDGVITLTEEGDLFIQKKEGNHKYSYAFSDFVPAYKLQVFSGEIELPFVSSPFTEEEMLLWGAILQESEHGAREALKENTSSDNLGGLGSYKPIDSSNLSDLVRSELQAEARGFSHLIGTKQDGNSGLSSFLCILSCMFMEEKVSEVNFSKIILDLEKWSEKIGITKSRVLNERVTKGKELLIKLYYNPSQVNLRKIVADPVSHSSINFVLRQLALMAISEHPDYVESLTLQDGTDSLPESQKKWFDATKVPCQEVSFRVIGILEELFKISCFKFVHSSSKHDISRQMDRDSDFSGAGILCSDGVYYAIFNQRIFQFV